MLEAANAAPSAGNLQASEIYVVRKSEHKKKVAEAALWQDFGAAAPVVLVFCANPVRNEVRHHERGQRLYSIQDSTISCAFAMLAAAALGLATVGPRVPGRPGAFDHRGPGKTSAGRHPAGGLCRGSAQAGPAPSVEGTGARGLKGGGRLRQNFRPDRRAPR
jgi:hypothetical protein